MLINESNGRAQITREIVVDGKVQTQTLNLVEAIYEPSFSAYKPNTLKGITLSEMGCFCTKKEAIAKAKELSIKQDKVQKIGTRFWLGWGIRYDFRYPYFYGECIQENKELRPRV